MFIKLFLKLCFRCIGMFSLAAVGSLGFDDTIYIQRLNVFLHWCGLCLWLCLYILPGLQGRTDHGEDV